MRRVAGRAAWLSTGLIAASSCATAPQLVGTVPRDLGRATSAVQGGCPAEHQSFPADDRPSVDRAPEPVKMVPPEYPATTGKEMADGIVLVHALICEHGRVVKAVVVKSDAPVLNEVAVTAMLKCIYRPAEQRGRPISTWIDVPFRFTIH